MKRYQIYGASFVVGIAVWLALMSFRREFGSEPIAKVVEVIPLYLIMTLGSYCLGKLGYDLLVFREDPREITALEKVCFRFSSIMFVLIVKFAWLNRK